MRPSATRPRRRSSALVAFFAASCSVACAASAQEKQPKPAPDAQAKGSLRFGSLEPSKHPAGTIRLACYNAENLFDDKDDPKLLGRYEDEGMEKPAEQCQAIADAIKRIDADVVAMQEVESYDAIIAFRDKYLSDRGYKYVVSIDAGDERGIEQAVLSRYPLKEEKNWVKLDLGGTHPEKWGNSPNENAGKPIQFHRSPLRVTVEVPSSKADEAAAPATDAGAKAKEPAASAAGTYELTLFVVHEKSGKDGNYWRVREAAKTVELAGEFAKSKPDANIIILGDFNSELTEGPLQTFEKAGWVDTFQDVPAAEPGTEKPAESGDKAEKAEGSRSRTRAKLDPKLITHASGRAIDHMLLNANVRKEFMPESRFVLAMPTRPEGTDYRVTPPPPGYGSDHFPIVIDLVPKDK